MTNAELVLASAVARDGAGLDALLALGNVYAGQGRWFAAKGVLRRAVYEAPRSAPAQRFFGRVALACGDAATAVAAFEACRALAPDDVATALVLADAYRIARRLDDAVRTAREAVRRSPSPDAHATLGDALLAAAGDAAAEAEAERAYAAALAHDAAHTRALNGMGALHRARGVWADARFAYDWVLSIDARDAEARFRRAQLDLRCGRYRRGYADYAAVMDRLDDRGSYYYHVAGVPLWDGAALNGRRLVVAYEAGLGDAVMMARFFPALRAFGGDVTIETPPELSAFFRRSMPGLRFRTARRWQPPDSADVHVPLMQLPAALGAADPLDVRPREAYLSPDPARVAALRERLALEPGRRHVGIVWHGDPRNPRDRHRSTALADWAPLAAVPNVRFHALQFGADEDALRAAPFPLQPANRYIRDIDDTAALMTLLDLVISVDTSTVHLAGALGRPVWLPNPLVSDWRWGLDEHTSHWYPSLRQFRQYERDAWRAVFADIATALRREG